MRSIVLLTIILCAAVVSSQTSESKVTAEVKESTISDLERQNLRGPMKSCSEERTSPAVTGPDGKVFPETKYRYATEYDREGRMLSSGSGDDDGWVSQHTYDSSGRLQKMTFGKRGEKPSETLYSYDEDGRLRKISQSTAPNNPTLFHYDEHGRKTEVNVFLAADYRPNMAVAGAPFESLERVPNLPGGGTVTTIFDEQDRPAEVRVQDASGEVVKRAVRVYDSEGRVVEEKQILESPEMIIPAELRRQLIAQAHTESGTSAEELQQQLRQELSHLMGGQSGPYSMSYTNDDKGRIKHTTRRVFNQVDEIENTYNSEGDLATEITRGKQPVGEDGKNLVDGPPTYAEVRHTYKYD